MEAASHFATLARLNLPFYEYAGEFCKLAAATAWDDVTLNHLFWLGANFHHPVDLPDTSGLSWREGIFRCLGSVRARARTSPPPFAGKLMPPFAAHSLRVRGPRKPAAVCGSPHTRRSRPKQAHAQARRQGVWQGKPACSEYGKPACGSCGKPAGRGSFQASARSSTVPSRARSSTAPSRARSSTAPSRARSSTAPSSARPSTAPSSASPSNALSCACASRAPPSVRASRAPPSA